ncbi:hypothetical protein BGW80DRAFT_1381380 [Lactifluus volemus]|nr:hypothetical protein BGW80DRAFT_1381380 [Lactifluus volemus]
MTMSSRNLVLWALRDDVHDLHLGHNLTQRWTSLIKLSPIALHSPWPASLLSTQSVPGPRPSIL